MNRKVIVLHAITIHCTVREIFCSETLTSTHQDQRNGNINTQISKYHNSLVNVTFQTLSPHLFPSQNPIHLPREQSEKCHQKQTKTIVCVQKIQKENKIRNFVEKDTIYKRRRACSKTPTAAPRWLSKMSWAQLSWLKPTKTLFKMNFMWLLTTVFNFLRDFFYDKT